MTPDKALDLFNSFYNGVLSGKESVCDNIGLAAQRQERDLKEGHNRGIFFDTVEASKWIGLTDIFYHWKGAKAGQKIEFEPHQAFYFGCLFGWKVEKTGLRRFTKSYKEVARKNAKTTEAAIKGILHLILDGEEGPQVYAGATKEDQAKIVVNDMGKIIKASPALVKKFKTYSQKDTIYRIVYPERNGFVAALGQDSDKQDGFDPSWGIIDEYHAHKTSKTIEIIESGMGSRIKPMIDIITTAGFNKESPCYNLRKVCIDILNENKVDDSLFTMIFSHDEDTEWDNEKHWHKSNPNINVSVYKDYLKKRIVTANNEGGTIEVSVKTKNFNIWTDASSVWIQNNVWKASNPRINKSELLGKECFVGLDLASKLDINAMAIFFPNVKQDDSGKYLHACLVYCWIPKEKKKKDSDHVDYVRWINEGFIKELGDYSIDFRDLGPEIGKILKEYDVIQGGFDRRYAHDGTVKDMIDEGYDMVEVIQNTTYTHLPIIELEKIVIEGVLQHFQNPVMRWMIGNVELYTDSGGSVRLDKRKSTGKIDGVAALVNAIFCWMANKKEVKQEAKIEIW